MSLLIVRSKIEACTSIMMPKYTIEEADDRSRNLLRMRKGNGKYEGLKLQILEKLHAAGENLKYTRVWNYFVFYSSTAKTLF